MTETVWETESIEKMELEEQYDLPELADSMEEAEARSKASTFLRALGHVEKEFEVNKAELANLIEHYTEQHYMRQEKLERQAAWLKESLEGLFGMMDAGNKKSLNLLGGQIGKKAQQKELVVEEDGAVIEWSHDNYLTKSLLRLTEALDRKKLRYYMEKKSLQEVSPPGVELVERPDVFFARPI